MKKNCTSNGGVGLSVASMIMEHTTWRIEDLMDTPHILRKVEAALRYYTGDGYQKINHAFQNSVRFHVQNTFLKYASYLLVPTSEELIVYRGCGMSETSSILNALENDIYVLDYDFPVSTSLFEHIANRFVDELSLFRTEYSTYVEYSAILAIRLPAETPVVYAGALSACDDEYEVLILPRVRMYIERVEKEFHEESLSMRLKIHTRAEVEPRVVEDEYVDDELVADWALRTGISLDESDNENELE